MEAALSAERSQTRRKPAAQLEGYHLAVLGDETLLTSALAPSWCCPPE